MRELPQVGNLKICVDDATDEYFIHAADVVPNIQTCEGVFCDVVFQNSGTTEVDGVTVESLLVVILDRLGVVQGTPLALPAANYQVVSDHLRCALLSLTA